MGFLTAIVIQQVSMVAPVSGSNEDNGNLNDDVDEVVEGERDPIYI